MYSKKFNTIEGVNIPKEKISLYNDKIFKLCLNKDFSQITQEEMYNCFSEKGGNHNLIFSDYDSYYEFSKAKKEIEEGQFFTPDNIIEEMYNVIKPSNNDVLADLTAGKGSFINFATNEKNFYANELDYKSFIVMRGLFPDANISNQNIKDYNPPHIKFDIVFGNPPFNIEIDGINSQIYYFIKSSELLLTGGFLVVLVPESFLADEFFNKSNIELINKDFNFICQYRLDKKTFKNANIKTKVMVFQKKSEFMENDVKKYTNTFESYADCVSIVDKVKNDTKKIKSKLYFENKEHSDNNYSFSNNMSLNIDFGYGFKLRKYLYEIKQHRKDKLNSVLSYIDNFKKQVKPQGMTDETWSKSKITEKKVIAYIKKFLNVAKNVRKVTKEQEISSKVKNRKQQYYDIHKQSYSDMIEDNDIKAFLRGETGFNLYSNKINDNICLTKLQEEDCNKMLQKNVGYLQYSQGAGKTICSLFQMQYRLHKKQVKRVYIVSHALCIGHWEKVLKEEFNIPFKSIKTLKDINNDESINLISFHYLSKYKRFLKKAMNKNRTMLVLDEADNISSIDSKMSKAVLNVFRKNAKYKLLLSGTMTRNNIKEAFTQFELLYNNNDLFKNNCDFMYFEDVKTKDITSEYNKTIGQNFKPYKKGLSQFISCFNPSKSTVFGVKKQNQDIYNYSELKELIDYTIITRSFEEVVGKSLYKINQITCKMNDAETKLYKTILEEFHSLERFYFSSIGNDRKQSLLRIIRQLNLLLKSCSLPHLFNEYQSDSIYSSKMNKVIETIKDKKFKKLAIGCIRVESVFEYGKVLREAFPEKDIYIVTGATHSIAQRKELIKKLENSDNYILVTTQQSLQSSLNINFIDDVLIVEMQYNLSKMSQFFFRFIRFDSVNFKNVYFITYEYSIESNLLQLIINKEKLNRVMKSKLEDDEKLYKEMGIDFDVFEMLHYKEKDKDGVTKTIWKQQEILV